MTSTLREALADLAEEARPYLNTEDAIEADRRRRRATLAVPAVALAVVVTLVATVLTLRPDGTTGPDVTASQSQRAGTPSAGTSPAATSPASDAPPLPPSGPVGVASYVYTVIAQDCARECPAYLVRPDGTRFLLEPSPRGGSVGGTALSPDGRWLGQRRADGYTVRDLTGTTVYRFGASVDAWVWSPDSRWLLLADHRDGTVKRYTRLDLRDGTTVDRADPFPEAVVGIQPDGLLVLGQALSEPNQSVLLTLVDPVSGEYQDRRAVIPELKSGEALRSLGGPQVFLAPGGTALVTVFTSGEDPQPVGVLDVDYTDPSRATSVISRHERPASVGAGATWAVRGVIPDVGILATVWNGTGTRLIAIHTVTGQAQVLAQLPEQAQVVVRGSARY